MYQRHYMCGVSLLLSTVVFLSAGCGKKGPLIYPDMLIAQAPKNITLEQTGSALRISFDMPEKDQSGHWNRPVLPCAFRLICRRRISLDINLKTLKLF